MKLDSVSGLPRVIALAGTLKMKGPSTRARPHRLVRLIGTFGRQDDALAFFSLLDDPRFDRLAPR